MTDRTTPLRELLPSGLPLALDLETIELPPDDSPHLPPSILRDQHAEMSMSHGSLYTHIGKRCRNEDKWDYYEGEEFSLYAIYDGHGTDQVSILLQRRLLASLVDLLRSGLDFSRATSIVFAQLEEQAIALQNSSETSVGGSTAIICFVKGETLQIANLGDSQAVLIGSDGRFSRCNRIHTLANSEEYEEVVQRGGTVIRYGRTFRLGGELALSRSIGDARFKPSLSATPEISVHDTNQAKWLIIASDGFWDEADPALLAKLMEGAPYCSARDIYSSLKSRPRDNATVMCVRLFA